MDTSPLLSKLIYLNKLIQNQGGRSKVMGNPDLEEIYDQVYQLEEEILKKFGLPATFKFRSILIELAGPHPDEILPRVEITLRKTAVEYLSSTPKNKISLLDKAREQGLKTYEILPEIGLEDGQYARYIYEEIFYSGIEKAEGTFALLKKIDAPMHKRLGQLSEAFLNKENLPWAKNEMEQLTQQGVKYLDMFVKYAPTYPY